MRYYDPFDAASFTADIVAPRPPRALEGVDGMIEAPVAAVARNVASGRRARLAARRDETPAPADADSWDFGDDPMLWARTRYAPRDPVAPLFDDAKPFEAPFKRTGQLIAQLLGLLNRAA